MHNSFWLSIFILFLAIFISLGILYSPVDPLQYRYPSLPALPSSKNELLVDLVKIPIPHGFGAESFAIDKNGRMYTGLGTGVILRTVDPLHDYEYPFHTLEFEVFSRTNLNLFDGDISSNISLEDCQPSREDHNLEIQCGRPLGMEFGQLSGDLYICDSSKGILKVSESGTARILVPSIDSSGRPIFPFVNSLLVDEKNSRLYFSHSSTRFRRTHSMLEMLEASATGSLHVLNLDNGEHEQLATGIPFANGIIWSHNRKSILISSCSRSAIFEFDLETKELNEFHTNLPVIPDNLSSSETPKHFWIAAGNKRAQPFSLLHTLSEFPAVRKVVAFFLSQELIMKLLPAYGVVLLMNEDGEIVRILQDSSKPNHVTLLSEVLEHQSFLFMGSFINEYIYVCRL